MALKPQQLIAIDLLIANPMISNVDLAKLVGCGKNTVGNWKRDKEFRDELQVKLKERWKDAEILAQEKMIDLCAKGNFSAVKYILDSLGYAPAQKVEADINSQNIVVTVEE
jgi:uncharacterized protein YjcR